MGYTLVYDSECGPCTRFREVVGFLDPGRRIRYLGLGEAEREGVLSGVPEVMRRRSFHLVSQDGSALSGSSALAALASQLPAGALTSAAIRTNPLVSKGVAFAYDTLARLHDSGTCGVAPGS